LSAILDLHLTLESDNSLSNYVVTPRSRRRAMHGCNAINTLFHIRQKLDPNFLTPNFGQFFIHD
jgi:hypothetical protein